jgi:hypothetical protein
MLRKKIVGVLFFHQKGAINCFSVRKPNYIAISLFHLAFQFTIYNGPTNALVCNKTLIQMSHTKTLKITPTYFDHQMIIIRELFDPG